MININKITCDNVRVSIVLESIPVLENYNGEVEIQNNKKSGVVINMSDKSKIRNAGDVNQKG